MKRNGVMIIPFTQYLTDYDLTEEWEKYLEEVELVEGCIYFDKDNGSENIFRFRKKSGSHLVYYSLKWEDDDEFKKGDKHSYDISEIRLATKKQKKKLIRAEVKNGYFHELN
jgi:hypothetical protein